MYTNVTVFMRAGVMRETSVPRCTLRLEADCNLDTTVAVLGHLAQCLTPLLLHRLLLLLPLLLYPQVLEVGSGRPLLSTPIAGCGETLLWWGASSDTVAFSARAGNSNTQLRLLKLNLQQQQQAVLYEPEPGERGLSLSLSHNRQFVILTSSVEVRPVGGGVGGWGVGEGWGG
jgi:hypothetical protein